MASRISNTCSFNTLSPRQNGSHFADDIFKCFFLNENVWIPNKISQKFVPKGPINNIPALVQIMAWRRPGDKPLSEPMMVSLPMHICVTQPQWVNTSIHCVSMKFTFVSDVDEYMWAHLSWFNSSWQHMTSWSTLDQTITCCLISPSYFLNHHWHRSITSESLRNMLT